MNDDGNERLIIRYRSVAVEEPSAELDRAILADAGRRAARVRVLRRGVALCAMLVVAVTLMTLSQHPHETKRPIPTKRGYGLQEGVTRDYLLNVSAIPTGAIDVEVKP